MTQNRKETTKTPRQSQTTSRSSGMSMLMDSSFPIFTFGIVFNRSAITNAALDLGVDAYTRLYADAKVGSQQNFVYCYGADGGTTLFVNIEVPSMFGLSLSRYYPLKPDTFSVIEKTCIDGSK
ncbi:hypothetical protein BCR34DRAFT_602899 [Clohesyomyces aquaticus]|uniref:Uncharacterized protein n=1 Tax=Clohesyomyces aquaticus TaxID=1231657 RepID=A0A1Y1ZHU7_9PLEO|nr:hypothetical protein BCR34DRAFT_602899 [Clohesyomyces aquaticus]